MRLESANAVATFSLSRGGRLGSLVIGGAEVLVTAGVDADFGWGSFPMAPYAGRVAFGRFEFGGVLRELPLAMPPHAIHGTAWQQPWTRIDDGSDHRRASLQTDFGPDWPFGGTVVQHVHLSDDGLHMALIVSAGDEPMPAMAGWHPWFRRFLLSGEEAELRVHFGRMYEVDDDGMPTGRLIDVPEGPWDNCFTDLEADPVISWPGVVELTLSSTCTDWVVFTERAHAFCVEPQTGAPNEFNRTPRVLQPGESLEAGFTIAWKPSRTGGT